MSDALTPRERRIVDSVCREKTTFNQSIANGKSVTTYTLTDKQLRQIFDLLALCPECNGEGGRYVEFQLGDQTWVQCEKCLGNGE